MSDKGSGRIGEDYAARRLLSMATHLAGIFAPLR
jgi:hypothetical protein